MQDTRHSWSSLLVIQISSQGRFRFQLHMCNTNTSCHESERYFLTVSWSPLVYLEISSRPSCLPNPRSAPRALLAILSKNDGKENSVKSHIKALLGRMCTAIQFFAYNNPFPSWLTAHSESEPSCPLLSWCFPCLAHSTFRVWTKLPSTFLMFSMRIFKFSVAGLTRL